MESKIFINDELCERVVIGTLLSESNALTEVREILNDECFYNNTCQVIYKAILKVTDGGDVANIITVLPELHRMKVNIDGASLALLSSAHTFDIRREALRLVELSKRRKINALGLYLQQQGGNESETIEDITNHVSDTLKGIEGESANHIKMAGEYLEEVDERIKANYNGAVQRYTHTGFVEIDTRGGLQPNNLIVVAADSSQGKTAFAGSVALNAAISGAGIAFYSLEMTGAQMLTRLVAIDSCIPCSVLFNQRLSSDEQQRYKASSEKIKGLNLYFDDRSSSNIDAIISSIRTMVAKKHVDGAIIDYLQILSVNTKTTNIETQLAEIARRLKNLANELNIWIMLLSQLSRDTLNPEPTLARLRGSGQINEAADTTILIYRPEYYSLTSGKNFKYSGQYANISTHGTALVNVAKGRNTGIYSFVCGFDANSTKFYDMDKNALNDAVQPLPIGVVSDNDPF